MTIYLNSPNQETLLADLLTIGIDCAGKDLSSPIRTDVGTFEYIGSIPIPLTPEQEEANCQAVMKGEEQPHPPQFLSGVHGNIYNCIVALPVFEQTTQVHPAIPYRKILSYE